MSNQKTPSQHGPSGDEKCFFAVDLFSGSGAVSAGLKAEGFKILAAIDNDPIACKTYSLNHPEVQLLLDDIRKIDASALAASLGPSRIDLLIVCAPCQPFSNQNRKRAPADPRSDLIIEAVKFVEAFRPKVVFFENVPGLASNGPVCELDKLLRQQGYFLSAPMKVDAADLGVPQRRERCILVATQSQVLSRLFGDDIIALKRTSVRSAIGHLPSLSSGQACLNDPLHRARNHREITLERLKFIPKNGGSRLSLPKRLRLKCHEGRDSDFPDVYGRLSWDKVAPTLTTGCTDVTKGRFAHPRDDRALTLREAALLQSFPSDYLFHGNEGQIARQIGNAVPVGMVKALAPYLISTIEQLSREPVSSEIKQTKRV